MSDKIHRTSTGGIFRALRVRNYALFFAGQGISLVGTFLQQVALGWYVYHLTGSKILLGTLAFASQIPSLFCTPLAGALADRFDRKKALVLIQTASGIQALVLAVLVRSGHAPTWSLVALSAALGTLNAFDIPFRQSFISQMVGDKALLPNALALNSALFNAARLVGPSVGGILVATWGVEPCFFLNAGSFVAVVAALLAIRPFPVQRDPRKRLGNEIVDGIRYVRSHRPIRDLLLLVSLVGLLGLAYTVIMPAFAKDVLHGDARTLGFLMAGGGAGALLAALHLASRRNVAGLLPRISLAAPLAGIGVISLSRVDQLLPAMALIAVSGFGFVTTAGGCNALIQSLVEDKFRGRVMSLYTLAFLGTSTVGSLAMGWLADAFGFQAAVEWSGGLFLAGSLVFAARRKGLARGIGERLPRTPTVP